MSQPRNLAKAFLKELNLDTGEVVDERNSLEVQFNPETLSLNFTVQNSGSGQAGGSAIQQAGQGTTKLTLDLWFDVTAMLPDTTFEPSGNVLELTKKVKFFILPKNTSRDANNPRLVTPGTRFLWGSFLFDGVMDSLNERLEFFSEEGKPLRAQLSIGLTKQDLQLGMNPGVSGGGSENRPGTSPFRQAAQRGTAQKVAADAGRGKDWKGMAAANGIENPRLLEPGEALNTAVGAKALLAGSGAALRSMRAQSPGGVRLSAPGPGLGAALDGIRKKAGLQFP